MTLFICCDEKGSEQPYFCLTRKYHCLNYHLLLKDIAVYTPSKLYVLHGNTKLRTEEKHFGVDGNFSLWC